MVSGTHGGYGSTAGWANGGAKNPDSGLGYRTLGAQEPNAWHARNHSCGPDGDPVQAPPNIAAALTLLFTLQGIIRIGVGINNKYICIRYEYSLFYS